MSVISPESVDDFSSFKLSEPVMSGVNAMGFSEPRPIQTATIPAVLEGRDVLGLAETGTGKTAAFGLPIIDRLLASRGRGVRALIIAPTRELANQIDSDLRKMARFTKLRTLTLFGGVPVVRNKRDLRRKPDIIVACPGRLLDLLGQRTLRLDWVETLVLDEADHLFDMGFLPDIRRILSALPYERQNLLFSATMPTAVRSLADTLLERPHVVELASTAPPSTISHALYPVASERKLELLKHLLKDVAVTSAIIFTRTKHRAQRLAQQLKHAGHSVVALQGNMSQSQRDNAMGGFRKGKFELLVATDIASRGIDVVKVSHVINFDMPNSPEAYTHRVGRTGRSECFGQACTLITSEDEGMVRTIERSIGSKIEREEIPAFAGDEARRSSKRPSRRSRKRRRR